MRGKLWNVQRICKYFRWYSGFAMSGRTLTCLWITTASYRGKSEYFAVYSDETEKNKCVETNRYFHPPSTPPPTHTHTNLRTRWHKWKAWWYEMDANKKTYPSVTYLLECLKLMRVSCALPRPLLVPAIPNFSHHNLYIHLRTPLQFYNLASSIFFLLRRDPHGRRLCVFTYSVCCAVPDYIRSCIGQYVEHKAASSPWNN